MKILIRQIKILLFILVSIILIIFIFSQTASPISPFIFKIRRLQEKIILKTKITPKSNLNYQLKLLGHRLNDLEKIVIEKQHSFILTSSLRYSTTAGEITQYIIANNISNEIPTTLEIFKKHQENFQKILDSYPRDLDNEWKFIQDDINYLNIYSDMLKSKM